MKGGVTLELSHSAPLASQASFVAVSHAFRCMSVVENNSLTGLLCLETLSSKKCVSF